mgnify:CR=1 FL=1
MKKVVLTLSLIVGFITAFVIIKKLKKTKATDSYEIGILQTASHPALDASRQGFMKQLSTRLGDKINFVIHNAQGNISQAHAIAQQFHANKELDAFFAIATPAAQALAAVEKQKPIVLSAVTDPANLGLIYQKTNVTGVSDMIDVPGTIDMITQLVPHAQTVGLLYTSGETNSITLAEKMRQSITDRGLTPLDFAVSNEADMQTVVQLACRKADVLLAPTDNTIAASIPLIISLCAKYNKPFIASDNMLVHSGALAARGVDYKQCGAQAANMMYRMLIDGIQPDTLAVERSNSNTIYINKKVANTLGIVIPQKIQSSIKFIL